MNGWQPIETAPVDGTKILGYDPNHEYNKIYVLAFNKTFWIEAGGEEWALWNPAYWMPLPESPKEAK